MKLKLILLILLFISGSKDLFCQNENPSEKQVNSLIQEAYQFYQLGRPDSAVVKFKQALALSTELLGNDHPTTLKTTGNLGTVLNQLGDKKGSLKYQLLAMKAFEKKPKTYIQPIALLSANIGNNYKDLGNLDSAAHFYQLSIQTYGQMDTDQDSAAIPGYIGLGELERMRGNFDQAFQYLHEALQICEKYENIHPRYPAVVYQNLGVAYAFQSKMSQARQYYQKALSYELKVYPPNHPKLALSYSNIGNSYLHQVQFELANEYFQKSLNIYRKINPMPLAAYFPLIGKGESYSKNKQFDQAFAYLDSAKSLVIKYVGRSHSQIAEIYSIYAKACIDAGKYEKAEIYADSALQISLSNFGYNHPRTAMAYALVSESFAQKNDWEACINMWHKGLCALFPNFKDTSYLSIPSISLDPHIADYRVMALTLNGKISTFLRVFAQTENIALLRSAYEHVFLMDSALKTWEASASQAEDKISNNMFYSTVAELGLFVCQYLHAYVPEEEKPKYLDDAFRFTDMSKSRILSQSMIHAKEKKGAELPPEIVQLESQLKNSRAQYEQQLAFLAPDQKDPQALSVRAGYLEASQKLDSLEKEIQEKFPSYYQLDGQKVSFSIPKIQESLAKISPNSALLTYHINDSSTYVGMITPEGKAMTQIGIFPQLPELIRSLRAAIQRKDQPLIQATSSAIYQKIWHPVDTTFLQNHNPKIDQIIILPSGILNYLPFEVLREDEDQPYLIEKYTLSYGLSAKLFVSQQKQDQTEAADKLLAIAPIFQEATKNKIPDSQTRDLFRSIASLDSLGIQRFMTFDSSFSYLPNSLKEVEDIAQSFRANGKKADVFIESSATEDVLKSEEISSYKYIHLATHGFSNDIKPQLSGLAFSPDADHLSDGLLLTPETYNLNLEAELVTLSACETGLGRLVRGEGVLGLSRAFLFAGAKNVLISLWSVEDQSTSILMKYFYDEILAGTSKSTALRQAKLKLLKDPKTSSPLYWAPFVLIGQ